MPWEIAESLSIEMFIFDHCYTPDENHKFLSELSNRGFRINPRTVEHPGNSVCRFINFRSLPGRRSTYLEFVSTPKGKRGESGFSFGASKSLRAAFESIRTDSFLRPRWIHRNYEWKSKGTRKTLPGWNFLTFQKNFSKKTTVWATEYELYGLKRVKIARHRPHPNSCTHISGFHFDINAHGRRFFERLLLQRVQKTIALDCGTTLFFSPAKRSRIRHVLLKASDFKRFRRLGKPDKIVEYRGKRAGVIQNPNRHWDILVAE